VTAASSAESPTSVEAPPPRWAAGAGGGVPKLTAARGAGVGGIGGTIGVTSATAPAPWKVGRLGTAGGFARAGGGGAAGGGGPPIGGGACGGTRGDGGIGGRAPGGASAGPGMVFTWRTSA
jgi:hypothetical protein